MVKKVGLCGYWWEIVVRGKLLHHTGNRKTLESILSSCGRRIYIDNILKPESLYVLNWWPRKEEVKFCRGRAEQKFFKVAKPIHRAFNISRSYISSQKGMFKIKTCMSSGWKKLDEFQQRLKQTNKKFLKQKLKESCYINITILEALELEYLHFLFIDVEHIINTYISSKFLKWQWQFFLLTS